MSRLVTAESTVEVQSADKPNVCWIHLDSVHPADTVGHGDSKFTEQRQCRHNVLITSCRSQ